MAATPQAGVDDIWTLIRESTSLAVVRDYLRAKKISHSATSWALLRERIDAALNDKKLSEDELYELLCIAEEHGQQHVFLYQRKASEAAKMLEPSTLSPLLKAANFPALPYVPRIHRKPPKKLTLVDVRQEADGSLVLKYVERREKYTKAEEGEEKPLLGPRQWVARWNIEEVRTVNIVKLRRDGLAEIRIHSGYAEKYENAVRALQKQTEELVPWDKFAELSLSKAKDFLWSRRDDLADKVAYSNSTLRDDAGDKINASTSRIERDLRGSRVGRAVQTFYDEGAHIDDHSIYFKPQRQKDDTDIPARQMHVVLKGQPNEYVIPVQCGIIDYEYALAELRRYNR